MKLFNNCRRGMALFLVLGAILLLSIMIMSYNYLVRGKFNETQNLLMHAQGLKAAKGAAEYLITKLEGECAVNSSDTQGNSAIRRAFYYNNAGSALGKEISNWVNQNLQENGLKLAQQLFDAADLREVVSNLSYTVEVEIVKQLKSDDKTNLFFPFEKCGYIRVKSSIELEKSRITEMWLEERPFRVIVPMPVPITKFTLYVKDAQGGNRWRFNNVQLYKDGLGKLISAFRPLCLNNGCTEAENEPDAWVKRGWVYLGGKEIVLNRASGGYRKAKGYYGQGFHSYYNAEASSPKNARPLALTYNLSLEGGAQYCFSVARWGFLDISEYKSGLWQQIFSRLYNDDTYSLSRTQGWYCSCLQLMGGAPGSDFAPTPTRIVGNVYDRFIEIAYLGDSAGKPLAALKYINENDYEALKQETAANNSSDSDGIDADENSNNSSGGGSGGSDGSSGGSSGGGKGKNEMYLKLLVMANKAGESICEGFGQGFKRLFTDSPFYASGQDEFAYGSIMSKITQEPYHTTANLILQYQRSSHNRDIHIPPDETISKITDLTFSSNTGLSIEGCSSLPNIDTLCKDPALGMKQRVCYEIKGENAYKQFKRLFITNNSLNLANAVVRVNSGKAFMLPNQLKPISGGAIITDGPIQISTFAQTEDSTKNAIVFLAEKGAITVNNTTADRPTCAYLIALGKDGELKYKADSALNLVGGAAVSTISPDGIKGGGSIRYNTKLDPTQPDFAINHLSVVIGPKGAE